MPPKRTDGFQAIPLRVQWMIDKVSETFCTDQTRDRLDKEMFVFFCLFVFTLEKNLLLFFL